MSADQTDSEPVSGREALVRALDVRRYARISIAVAGAFAVAVAVYFVVLLAGGETSEPQGYYLALAFVVFVSTAMLLLGVLVCRRVLALAVHPVSLVRAGATGGLLAGGLWLAAAVGLALGPGRPWATLVDVAAPWAPLVTIVGLWAVYTRYKRTAVLRPVAAVATVVALGGALLLASVAAAQLIAMLPDVGRPVDHRTVVLYSRGAIALVGGQTALGVLAVLGDEDAVVPAVLALPPLAGLGTVLALDGGRTGLTAFAAGLAGCWLLAGWRLRGLSAADVPANPAGLGEPPAQDESGADEGASADSTP